MPPKASKGSDKNKDVAETEDVLQAVVLSDSFETHFNPFTLQRPRCLLPLANVPLIEYTLEYLASNRVEQVFVYCSAHTDQIEAYLQCSKWTKPHAPFRLHILRSTSRSIGDAMRDLDKRAILANDFFVVYGDVVANIPLGPGLAAHRARRAADKNSIMTMVLAEGGLTHRTKANDMLATFVIDTERRRCLQYQQLSRGSGDLQLDPDIFDRDLEIRTDLIDCGIDICTPDVLALWSDNFDYEKPRAGFLHSVLKDYELNGKTIHTHIVNDGYAARVRNLQAYGSVSRDVMEGWSWPFTPRTNWSQGMTYGPLQKPHITREEDVVISKTAWLSGNVILGSGSHIGSRSVVRDSIIGRGCTIGEGCRVRGAFIWDNVTMGNDVEVSNAIIASNVEIGAGSTIYEGSLVSYSATLPERTILGKRKRVFRGGEQGRKSTSNDCEMTSSNEDEEVSSGLLDSFHHLHLGSTESISTLGTEESEEEDGISQHRTSITSQGSEDSHQDHGADSFVTVNAASINDSLQNGHDVSTIQLELQSQRMAVNASEHQVRHAVASGLCRYVLESKKQGKQIYQVVSSMRQVFERMVFDGQEEQKSDQVDFLLLCQAELAKKNGGSDIFSSMCSGLYQIEDWEHEGVFEGEAFEQWWQDERSQKTAELKVVRDKLEKFIELVTTESSEGDEDESEEDE